VKFDASASTGGDARAAQGLRRAGGVSGSGHDSRLNSDDIIEMMENSIEAISDEKSGPSHYGG
jgi:hypothetical protein